jgi:hypothetical protein
MTENQELCTILTFLTLPEAQMACAKLEQAEVNATIFNESINMWVGALQSFGGLQVKVLSSDLERAKAVLDQEPWDEVIDWSEANRLADGGKVEDEPKPDPPTTVTTVPDERNPGRLKYPSTPDYAHRIDQPTVTAKSDATTAQGQSIAQARTNAPKSPDTDEPWADRQTKHAYGATIIGICLFCLLPAIHLYSIIVLLLVACSGKRVSPRYRWRYYTTLIIDVLAILLWSALVIVGLISEFMD